MTSEQPMPAPGRQDVTPVARELFASMLAEREAKGIRTYGTTLQTHNGRDAVQDALEECIDLWQYLVQIRLERGVLLARLDALEAERDELLATSRERGASMSRACTAMARDAVTIRDLTGRLAAAEAALRLADEVARLTKWGITVTDCREGCEHPACLILRAIAKYRKASAALAGSREQATGEGV